MKARTLPALTRLLGLGLLCSGCVLSIDPVVTDSEATFDSRLIGTWQETPGSDRAVVSRASANLYAIEYTTGAKTGRLEGRLGRLGDKYVLDVWPAPPDRDLLDPYRGFLIGGHLLVGIDVSGEEVRVALLEPDSLRRAIAGGGLRLRHLSAGDRVILSGTSQELRTALGTYIRRSGALGNPGVFRRTN